ncbi:LLM class flavin-dependent oxidoreductase [Phytoactinopolyspora endophytica]|uniref:LLM class flavin-dependent oxidoreductase n=1 Tax=Phytoactinopolyspora endophytica TaxID=1642495 RepID=UPI0013EB3398|nr:LLM class flavin-dependent oxidoreductase [Phytoactinopolyspora endophytica]
MKIGIGLSVAVPGRPPREIRQWAEDSERLGFHSLGSIDRLIYDILDPLVSLGAAAAVTERIQLFTSVLNVGWRNNPILFAKQLATIDLISEGRLTAGLGIGGWPDDFAASGAPTKGHGKLFDDALTEMRRVWDGDVKSISGATPLPGAGRPRLLIAGLVQAGYARAARFGDGWVAPTLSRELLTNGVRGVNEEWAKADRSGKPQILTGRYFCCGPDATDVMSEYVAHYYGSKDPQDNEPILADSIDSDERLLDELIVLSRAGVDDVVLYPASSSLDQVHLLAEALERVGARRNPTFEFTADSGHTAMNGTAVDDGEMELR